MAHPSDAPTGEPSEQAAEARSLEAQMEEALELNAKLRGMVLEIESRSLEPSNPKSARPLTSAPKSLTGMAMRAPREGKPGAGGWGGKTHTEARASAIDRDNAILVSKLSNIATREKKPVVEAPVRIHKTSSSTVNRNRHQTEIARENARIAMRLSSVKATAGLSGKSAAKHASEHKRFLRIASRNGICASPSCAASCSRMQSTSPIGALTGLQAYSPQHENRLKSVSRASARAQSVQSYRKDGS